VPSFSLAANVQGEKLNLTGNHFYFTLLGELHKDIDKTKARQNFQQAFSPAKTATDKQTIQKKIEELKNNSQYNCI